MIWYPYAIAASLLVVSAGMLLVARDLTANFRAIPDAVVEQYNSLCTPPFEAPMVSLADYNFLLNNTDVPGLSQADRLQLINCCITQWGVSCK